MSEVSVWQVINVIAALVNTVIFTVLFIRLLRRLKNKGAKEAYDENRGWLL